MPERVDPLADASHDVVPDELTRRIAAVLRPLPDVDGAAKARLLIAVAAERERDRERAMRRQRRRSAMGWAVRAGSLAAAAVLGAFAMRDLLPGSGAKPTPAVAVATATAPAGSRLAARNADADAALVRVPVQLVFRAPATASRVRVAGDFNGWNASQSAMQRDAETGLWSVTLALRPGRHVYAFVVDDSIWVRDPRAQAAPDADFGRPGSVLLVGTP